MSAGSSTHPYPTLQQILNAFRVQELRTVGNLLGIRTGTRKQEKIDKIIGHMQELQNNNQGNSVQYREAFQKIRGELIRMSEQRRGWATPPNILPAIHGMPPCLQDTSVAVNNAVQQTNNAAADSTPQEVQSRVVPQNLPGDSRVTRSTANRRKSSPPNTEVTSSLQIPRKDQLQNPRRAGSTVGGGRVVVGVGGPSSSSMPPPPVPNRVQKTPVPTPSQNRGQKTPAPSPSLPPRPRKVNEGKTECICNERHDKKLDFVVCEDCGVRQHRACVRGTGESTREARPKHFCEWCRVKWADPFSKIIPNSQKDKIMDSFKISGDKQFQTVSGEKTVSKKFYIEKKGSQLGKDYQLKIGCIQLGDPVDFRFHWPQHAELIIKNHNIHCYKRQPQVKLGINSRDDAVSIEIFSQRGRNDLYFSMKDENSYCVVIYMAKKQDISEVKKLMAPTEPLRESLQRVIRCVSCGDDDDIIIDKQKVNLNCQMTCCRIRTPARFTDHENATAIFDLDTFLKQNQKQLKWYCPHFMTHSRISNLQIDSYMQSVINALKDESEVQEIEINQEGKWRIGEGHPWQDVLQPSGNVRRIENIQNKRNFSSIQNGYISSNNNNTNNNNNNTNNINNNDDDDDNFEELDEQLEFQNKRRRVQQTESVCLDLTGSDDGADVDQTGGDPSEQGAVICLV